MLARSAVLITALSVAGAAPVPATGQEHVHPSAAPVAHASGHVRVERVRLESGVELEVAFAGPADGTPVLFLHGITDSWYSFSLVLDRLPPGVRAIAPSQRGHGDSDRPDCCYEIADFATDAMQLLDALGVERAVVVGHSMGSFVGQHLAVDWPERVDRLVLVGSAATPSPPLVELERLVRSFRDPVAPEFVREFQESTVLAPVPTPFMGQVIAETGKLPARVWRDAFRGLVAESARRELSRIRVPTLVVWGEGDGLFSRSDQDALLGGLPEARFLVYERTGHAPHWEQPGRFANDLHDFLMESVGLLSGLGSWAHPVTASQEAQRFFDQGLRLTYAFNHDEAVHSFEEAARLDPACAMCWWGIAYALGPNINMPMEPEAERRAAEAVQRARVEARRVTAAERAYIDALTVRYREPTGADQRAARDSAYADQMRRLARMHPEDIDAQVLFADAMLNLRPWNQWTRAGEPQPGTEEVVRTLEAVILAAPDHAGACHFYIHTVEASSNPERALPCAERLPGLMPGAGHVVHMPAHVFLRVGRYQDAARANIAAVEADHRYFSRHGTGEGIYPLFYAPHNLHFLWAAYLLSGQRGRALRAARALEERVTTEDALAVPALEGFLTSAVLALVRFESWEAVLAEPSPAPGLRYATGMWHYARGMAFAATGDTPAARAELDDLRALAATAPPDLIIILNPASALLGLASEVLAGWIAAREGRLDDAVAHLRRAVSLEEALTYDEPPPWYQPVRNLLGEVLLKAGRPQDAEAAFLEDLRFVRENGWSLSGLERALAAQGRPDEARAVRERFLEAWKHADVPPPGR